jgi:ATP-binding cassette subfamily F protein uup
VYGEVGENSEVVRLGDQSTSLRSYLRRFPFSEERINTKIAQLSGGERSRIVFAKILKRGGNVLIFDEPTNDLDLDLGIGTLRLLEEALVAFTGSVIVVSHDRDFLNRVCTPMLAFEGYGVVTYWAGNYYYYLQRPQECDAVAATTTKPPSAPATATAAMFLLSDETRHAAGVPLRPQERLRRVRTRLRKS